MEEMFVPSLADAVVLAQWHLQSAMGVSWRRISLPAIARGLQERANAAVGRVHVFYTYKIPSCRRPVSHR